MLIRAYRPGEEAALREVFRSSVHQRARRNYSAEQLDAWAPLEYDQDWWNNRIRGNRPFVAEIDGRIAGYADLQDSGYIDQFFVAGGHTGHGVGSALMRHLLAEATRRRIGGLFADVSLTAESFFARHGFTVETRRQVVVRGVTLANARMRRTAPEPPVARSGQYQQDEEPPA
ncbi:GNAT family N-acetyltransferase [Solimonas sp. SE-A11]|uniref:GNAT family N-acetyltransferase n=1 Tax=Solimonas sp. SE-A11 TaxID=3054954 RepID=UPI00259C7193|nr:GNAT family N-acetyltransferase [Solimonas sp. SE-A11]MDM4769302.1 GNAT family N-acetyltransferase [Solimonas sp. SE-A11]